MNRNGKSNSDSIKYILGTSWNKTGKILKHTFLAGNLKNPLAHPFLNTDKLEIIICTYEKGDHGYPHWHLYVDEFEFVIEGKISYRESLTGISHDFTKNDLIHIPKNVCVNRIVDETCITITLKVPSKSDKVSCFECSRVCDKRIISVI